MEVVNKYYLGFVFTTTLSVKQGTDHLVAKGKKAVFNLYTSFQKCREMTKNTFFQIFDSKIQPLLLNSSEIWGIHILDSIERVHLISCKRYLGVQIRTPNKMVYGELGTYPLFIASYVRCIKYCFRLLCMEQSRLPNQAYRMPVNFDENGKQCWATEVRELLCKTGFYFVWLQQGVRDVNSFSYVFKHRLLDMFARSGLLTSETKKDMKCIDLPSYVWSRKIFISYRYILFQSSTDATPTWCTSNK